jgi:hypothetical protein
VVWWHLSATRCDDFSSRPDFTITAVLILGFGIGANTAIFSLIHALVLNPLPFPHPDGLVSVVNTTREYSELSISLLNYEDFYRAQQSFDELAAASEDFLDLSDAAGSQRLDIGFVSATGNDKHYRRPGIQVFNPFKQL